MSANFDPNAFLDQTVEQANSTVMVPVPAREYVAIISEVKSAQWQKKDDPSVSGLKLQLTWDIDDSAVKAELGRDKVTVRQEIMLDLTDNNGLDMGKGKNVQLGRVREALGLNRPGQAFSPSMLNGRAAKIMVTHRIDPRNTDVIYAEVKAVAPM